MKTKALLKRLSVYYPQRLKESYDHVGLMEGKLPLETKKIMLCLDFDDEIYEMALKEHPDLIISHHPFFFGNKKKILAEDPVKASLNERMEKSGIPILSYHTNFDNGFPGMNDALASLLHLQNVRRFPISITARGGDLLKPMEVHEFAKYAKECLGVSYGLLINAGTKTISSVGLIGGGGWMENLEAQKEGYDIFISGDMPHHGRREVVLRHYNYLDLPHEIENAFMERMKATLLMIDPTLDIVGVKHEKLPEVI